MKELSLDFQIAQARKIKSLTADNGRLRSERDRLAAEVERLRGVESAAVAIREAYDLACTRAERLSAPIYVLTREECGYDVSGEYFVAVFRGLPTDEQLNAHGIGPTLCDHIKAGGGRIGLEDPWYYLRAAEFGKENQS